MTNNNYFPSFYVIKKDNNLCNLYNKTTDNIILELVTENEVKNFLTMNSPSHPFLTLNENVCESFYMTDYKYDDYNNLSVTKDPTVFNAGSYCYDLSGYENKIKEVPEQLEFNFNYSNKDNDNRVFPDDDIDIPYLGDNED
tara:strand:+ start:68 stop:490 length:423 start_codon:yes stop_codon:yes gene_type:complete